jgi:hypothetical protein
MTKGEISAIARISEEAWRFTEKLCASRADMSPPAPLEGFAKELGIRCVRFKPLLSDGALAKEGKDLEIVLNTEAPGAASPAGTTLSVDDGKWGELKPPLRFSVSHEIAHAVFLKAAGSHRDLFQKNEQAVENACNILARVFLLPRSMLVREIDSRLFDVDHLSKLVHAFGVSPEVFLRRFHVSDMRGQFAAMDGLLAFIQDKGENIEFKACHMWGTHAITRFQHGLQESRKNASEYLSLSADYKQTRWALEGLKLNEIGLGNSSDTASRLKNKQADHIEIDVEWVRGEVIPCSLSFRLIRERPLGWLLCLQFMAPV